MARDLEIELKLEVDPADFETLTAAPMMAGQEGRAKDQVSTYFDTPGQDLREAGLSLRVRRIGGNYVQTVKAEGAPAAGLFARPEWEKDIAGDQPEIDDAAGPLAAMLPDKALQAIAPAFTAEVIRTSHMFAQDGAVIEVVLDAGAVLASGRSEPISEIELELKSGAPAALFSLARQMNAVVPLYLGVLTKADRGYRLVEGRDPKSVKAEAGVVRPGMTVAEAFQAIAGACLRQFRLNEIILFRTDGPEPLHQARVALRRLRSALSIFKPILQDEAFERMRQELRWLAAMLGEARDIDVLLARKGEDDKALLRDAREQAYVNVRSALTSERARSLMIDLSEWLAIGGWRTDPETLEMRDVPARYFAAESLNKLRRRVKRRGRNMLELEDEERHEVRILAKKLRYSSEFFAGLFTGKKAARRGKDYLSALEDLQQHLGDLNDIAHEATVRARIGMAAVQEERADERESLLAQAAKAHDRLADTAPFWR